MPTYVATDAERAESIRKLYGLDGIHAAQVQRGVLPVQSREGAPDWERRIRQRLHDLLKPNGVVVGVAEEQALVEARIPLLPRPSGDGRHIDPAVRRESGLKAARDDAERAQRIRWLYGLDGSTPAQAQRGVLPTRFRKGAPDWENQIRKRLHNLLQPDGPMVGVAEEQALVEARIPLLPRPSGDGRHINRAVSRASAGALPNPADVAAAAAVAAPAGALGQPSHTVPSLRSIPDLDQALSKTVNVAEVAEAAKARTSAQALNQPSPPNPLHRPAAYTPAAAPGGGPRR